VKQSESATLTSDLQKLWRPVLVSITVVIITVFLWQGLKQQEQVQIDRNIKFAASSTSQEITTQIHTRILALERMGQRWELQKGTPQAEWEADAINYWQDYPGFKAIKLVDKSYRVRWIVPQKEKEALLKESVESDELSKTILDKAKAGQEVLIRSTTLDQGSKGFFVYIPLFLDNSESQSENNFDGFIVGVFSTQPLLDTILNQDFTEHYSINIFDKKEEIYTNSGKYLNSHIKTQWSHQSKINLKNLTWQLKVSPTPAMLVEAESSLPTVVLGAGLLTSLLLALVVYLQGRSRQYAENLEERNIDLFREIKERKIAEEELRWREALLRSMANASPLAFYVEDERTNEVLYFNSYFCEIWGIECTQEELQQGKFNNSDNKKFQLAGCSDCKPTVSGLAAFRKVCKPPVLIEKQTVVEDEISLPQGRVLRRLSTQICDKQDKYFGRLYIFEDITNAKLAEVERRNLSTALKSAVEGISQLDSLGHYTYVNHAYADMLGYEPEEMLGMTGLATVYPEDQQKVADAYQIMLVSGKAETEVRAIRRDGSTFDKQMVIVKATDLDPDQKCKDVAYYCFIKDISHRREVERLKDEFVSLVSHELRTPLTSIRGSLGLVANGVLQSKPEKAQRMVEIAVNNTDRLIRLINDILDIERIESGKVQMTKQICDVASLVTQSADVMRNMAEKSDITLHVTTVPAQIWADPDRIIQTLTNLLSNAIKFSEPKSTVWLSCEIPQFPTPHSQFPTPNSPLPTPHSPLPTPQILLKIKDQGRGIPADKLESIFERFQQVDASDSRSKGGTGLGLPICRSIVQHHDGEIWVESTLNEGATFYVALPLLPEKEVEAPVNKFNAPLILVCDDDPGVQTVLQGMLQQQGYRVICVASGQEALQEAQRQQPNVIFLNLMMPEMNGWETLAALKQESRTQDIPVIILSGLMPDAREIPNQQISNWIVKPPDEKLMFQALERVLSGQNQEVKVLVVEDDLDLAQVLIAMFERYGVKTYHATTGRQAIEMSQRLIPHLLVLDLALPEVSGYAVVDWLRQHNHLRQVPLVVYCAQDLSEGDRQRLNLGETLFLTKGRVTPEEFEERVIDLLRRMV
jgi:hypothetical protein